MAAIVDASLTSPLGESPSKIAFIDLELRNIWPDATASRSILGFVPTSTIPSIDNFTDSPIAVGALTIQEIGQEDFNEKS
tara:strand:- start:626 stop:865 length:240 start_codon:yes stop_codon:yes gene_type:complete